MTRNELIFAYITIILGLIVEAVIAIGLVVLLLNGIGLLLEALTQYINPAVGIMLVAVVMIVFLIFDGSGGEDNERRTGTC